MNIEELSKAQLLLLTVMVNFVVSIATGILTVSLLDNAPLTVTQTVDRIVDHTIQTISTPIQVASIPIKSVTQSVAQSVEPTPPAPTPEEQLTAAVAADAARTVLIHKNSTTTPAIAFGTYLPKSHAVVTAQVQGLPKQAVIEFADGSAVPASLSKTSNTLDIYGFADAAVLPDAPAATLPAASTLKQGQTVIALTKDSAATTGIISKVDTTGIQTTLSGVPAGAGVVDLSGAVIGIADSTGMLIPADAISALLAAPAATKK